MKFSIIGDSYFTVTDARHETTVRPGERDYLGKIIEEEPQSIVGFQHREPLERTIATIYDGAFHPR